MRKWKRHLLLLSVFLFVLYVGSYIALSRRGYSEAALRHFQGFYYLTPEDSYRWRFGNYACVCLYLPLNELDRWLGFGRHPASEPLWGFSAYQNRYNQ